MTVGALCVAGVLGIAAPSAAQQPGDVAARMGDRTFTVKELDEAWKASDAKSKAEAEQAIYDGRKDALDRLVAEMLVEQAAKQRGVDAGTYMADEVAKRVKPVTDADVSAFFKANTNQMQGRPLEDVASSIRGFLEEQQEDAAHTAIIAELRKGAAPVRVALEPPRVVVSIAPHDPVRGPATAAVTLVEFSDYQCPFCSRVTPTLKRLRDTYGERLRIVWKDFPLYDIHPLAQKAAEAAWCAGEQGKYWEFHDRLFVNQSTLGSEGLKQHATAVGLEPKGFATCLDSGRHADRVKEGAGLGRDLGVDSTPTAFINGRRVTGAHPYEVFAEIIDDELARAGK
ncbi:MAG: thioredoxin domain-containing protein [Vicinamibacterales bacterium]